MNITERVNAGYQFLLEQGDDFSYINIDTLDLKDDDFCVLGQRDGSFEEGLDALGIIDNDGDEEAIALGFMVACYGEGTYLEEFDELTKEWTKKFRERGIV